MITVVHEKTILLWMLPTASKRPPTRIIHFIITTLKNEQHPCKCAIVDEYSALENSTDLTKPLVDDLNVFMETTGGDSLWINKNNERHNISIHNMVRE